MTTFEQSLEGGEVVSQVTIQGESVSGKDMAGAKTQRQAAGLVYSRSHKEASVAGVQWGREL